MILILNFIWRKSALILRFKHSEKKIISFNRSYELSLDKKQEGHVRAGRNAAT